MKYFLSFQIEKNHYGISIENLVEVVYMVKLIPVPALQNQKTSSSVLGLVNVRGEVFPVFSLRKIFGYPEGILTHSTRILLLKIQKSMVGLVVDSVEGVKEVFPDQLKNVEVEEDSPQYFYISHIFQEENQVYLLLRTEKLLGQQEIHISGLSSKKAKNDL